MPYAQRAMTVREILAEAAKQVDARDAQVLLAHAVGREKVWLLAHANDGVDPAKYEEFRRGVERRAGQEPLQYITCVQEFYGMPLKVTPATLIPRPETELLVEAVIAWAAEHDVKRVVDVGAGSGAIAIALARRLPGAAVTSVDVSLAALEVARENATRHRAAVRFLESDLLAAVSAEVFDVVVSNPPYVALADAPTLADEVVKHEPHTALFAGEDGMAVYQRLIPQAHAALRGGGLLAMEFGFGQRDALAELLRDGWKDVRFRDDYAGIPRIVMAEKL